MKSTITKTETTRRDNLITTMKAKKGEVAVVTFSRPVRIRKDAKNQSPIMKQVSQELVIGFEHDADEVLPWGKETVRNLVITHKGEKYGRFTPIADAKRKISYYRDGKRIRVRDVERAALASEFNKSSSNKTVETLTISIANIEAID